MHQKFGRNMNFCIVPVLLSQVCTFIAVVKRYSVDPCSLLPLPFLDTYYNVLVRSLASSVASWTRSV